MKIILPILLIIALLWIASVAWSNRRKSTYGGNGSDGSSVGDSCDTFFSPDCGSDNGACSGGDSGGGD